MMHTKVGLLGVLILTIAGLPARGEARLFMTLPGQQDTVPASGDHIIVVQPGETFTIETWVADSAPVFSIRLEVAGIATRMFGSGTVDYVDTPGVGGSVTVNTARPEWLFSGSESFVSYGEQDLPVSFWWSAFSFVGPGLVHELRYVGEFQFTASPDSGGVFVLTLNPSGTRIVDPNLLSMSRELQRLVIVISPPCEVGAPGDCSVFDSICTVGVCDEPTGRCFIGALGDCDDGLFCNGSETCVFPDGCNAGVSPCELGETCYESIDACMVDCNENMVEDACDIECGPVDGPCNVSGCGSSEDSNGNGVPDACEACLSDSDCDDGVSCNGVETCEFPEGCHPGVSLCEPDESCDESVDACVTDCNGNRVVDACDIDCGLVGGACDVPGCGTSDDCDDNGVPDVCEVHVWEQDLLIDGTWSRSAVAVDGDLAVIGANRDGENGANSGAVHVFRRLEGLWVYETKLLPDTAAADGFGASVSVSGDVIVIGACCVWGSTSPFGSAYVYRWTDGIWVREAELIPDDGANWGLYGLSVSVSGDTVVIGGLGEANVFRRIGSSWVHEATLLPDDLPSSGYGDSVAVSDDVAVIGALLDDASGHGAGAAYVFRRKGANWTQETKLLPEDVSTDDWFGRSVAVSGDVAVVGAPGALPVGGAPDDGGGSDGSAYVFRRTAEGWSEEAKLVHEGSVVRAHFGYSVAVSGGTAIVGAMYDRHGVPETGSGSAYVFRDIGEVWEQEAKLLPDDGAPRTQFGASVGVSGDSAIVGAGHVFSISEYLFQIGSDHDCNENDVLDVCDIADGVSLDCNGDSVPDECEPYYFDVDCDGDVDLIDYAAFVVCFTGSGLDVTVPECAIFDFDADLDVDLLDFGGMQSAFTCVAGS